MSKNRIAVVGFVLVLSVILTVVIAQAFGTKKKRPKPQDFGNVVINNFSEKNNIAPVVFKHWIHRSKYTCRLCHVDVGFAMEANGTGLTELDNKMGMYCGACHNGTEAFGPESIDAAGRKTLNCEKCHSLGQQVDFKYNFFEFKQGLPRERFGNGIDWQKAEEENFIQIKDYLEGVSIKRAKIQEPEEFSINAKEKNMPKIIFSHKKHAMWNGCELCHPEIFQVKKGAEPYSMREIFDGKYCGLCHGPVAFPNLDCQRCHTDPV